MPVACLYRRVSADAFVRYDPAADTFAVIPADRVPALTPATPRRVRMSEGDPAARRAGRFRRLILSAMLEFQHRGHRVGSPESAQPYLDHLAKLLDDPDAEKRLRLRLSHGTGSPPPHKFSSTHVPITGDAATRILELGRSIRDEDLGEDGRETDPHVTIRYGLHTDSAADVKPHLTGSGPVKMRLGKVSVFRGADSGKPYDVLKVDVDSPDLHRLNAALKALPHTDTHPEYKPHATIGYVKAGLGDDYAARMGSLDVDTDCPVAVFSNRSRKHATVRLSWSAAPTSKGGVKAVGAGEHAGRTLYGARAQAALRAQEARGGMSAGEVAERSKKSSDRAREIIGKAVNYQASKEEIQELAEHLPHLPAERLRSARLLLGASFGGGKTVAKMRSALMDHVRGLVDRMDAEEKEPKPEPDAPTDAPAPQPAKPKTPKAGGPPKPGEVRTVPTGSLKVDPTRFQFKLNTNESGVTKELREVKTFNPEFAGVVAVWKDPADGQDYVVNGHHRHELASRTGHPDLAVRYLEAKDAREARAKGALINIAEGRGTAVDAAKFMRDMGVAPEDLEKHGVSLKGKLASDAATLTNLNDKAFDRVARGSLDPEKALAVARHLADPVRQEKLFSLLDKREEEGKDLTGRTIEELARQMAAVPGVTKTESTLWGDETTDEDTFVERAELASHVRGELAKDHNDFAAVASDRRAGKVAGAGNTLNVDENKKRAEEAAGHKDLYDIHAHRKGPVADALDAAAVAYKKAKTKKERDRVRTETVESVRAALKSKLAEFAPKPAAGSADGAGKGGVDQVGTGGGGAEPPTPAAGGGREVAADAGRGGEQPTGVAADPFTAADADHGPALEAVKPGDTAFVAGHKVRRTKEGKFQVEDRGTYKTGTAAEISDHIRQSWQKNASWKGAVGKALARASAYSDPDPFTDAAKADEDTAFKAAVPAGAKAVSLEDNTRGRVGTVVRDPDTGAAHILLDGGGETKVTDWEPLESHHSWRGGEARTRAERAKAGPGPGLFDEPAPAPAAPAAPAMSTPVPPPPPPASPPAGHYDKFDKILAASKDRAQAEQIARATGVPVRPEYREIDKTNLEGRIRSALATPAEWHALADDLAQPDVKGDEVEKIIAKIFGADAGKAARRMPKRKMVEWLRSQKPPA